LILEIAPGVYSVGAADWERRLFDGLIPLPQGTSYNSYLIQGREGTVLLDTVDPSKREVLLGHLRELGVRKLDYVVVHHAEQDHSGSLPEVLREYPEARVLAHPKGKELIQLLLHVPGERIGEVRDGETLSLGDKTLQFLHTPWVHWPDTMVTYLREEGILFTCDFLGSHLATSSLRAEEGEIYPAAKRYYAEIMMPFRSQVRKNLERVRGLSPRLIAPSHGPLHPRPDFILGAYEDWSSDRVKNEVVLPYLSMHGSVKRMVEHLTDSLASRGVRVKPFELSVTDVGELAMALVDAATLVVGCPTVLGGPHPVVLHAAQLASALRPKLRFFGVVASYGWGGRTVETLSEVLSRTGAGALPPVLVKGYPSGEDLRALEKLAETIAVKHRELGLEVGG
jgi:flavorubredoxin